jgi:hypothetical protein
MKVAFATDHVYMMPDVSSGSTRWRYGGGSCCGVGSDSRRQDLIHVEFCCGGNTLFSLYFMENHDFFMEVLTRT